MPASDQDHDPAHDPARAHVTGRGPTRRPSAATTWATSCAVAFALAAGHLAPLTAPAEITVALVGAAITAWALGVPLPVPRARRRPAPQRIGARPALPWLALLLAGSAWELVALAYGTPAHPTLSALAGPLLAAHLSRSAAYLLWLAAGAWLARR